MSESGSSAAGIILIPAFCASLLFSVPAESAIRYNGSLGANEEDNGRILQHSNQRVALDFTQLLSDRTTTEESVLYNSQWQQGYGTTAGLRRDTVSPSASLMVDNDLFRLGLTGSADQTVSDAATFSDSDTVELNWSSKWHRTWAPDVRLTLGQRNSYDSLDPHVNDKEDQNVNSSASWNFGIANVYYGYNLQKTNHKILHTEDENESHLIRLGAQRGFLGKRLRVNFSQDFRENTVSRAQHIPVTGSVRVDQTIFQSYTGIDASPADGNDFVPLTAIPNVNTIAVTDNDLLVSAYTASALTDDHNIIIRVGNNPVDLIYLYTAADRTADWTGLHTAPPSSDAIELYTNSVINLSNWANESAVIDYSQITYDTVNRRMVIPLISPIQRNYLKIHFNNTLVPGPGQDVQITEVEASALQTGSPGSTSATENRSTGNNTSLGFMYKANNNFQLNYVFSLQMSEDSAGNKSDLTGHVITLRLQSEQQDIYSTFDFSDRLIEQNELERSMRSYGFVVGKTFLPTLQGNVSGTRQENYLREDKTSTNDRYTFNLNAQLYPDLESRLEGNYLYNKILSSNSESESFNTELSFTSRLRPSLSVTLAEKYNESRLAAGNTEKYTSLLQWNLQASDIMSINGSVRREDSNQEEELVAFQSTFALGIGYRMQLEIEYYATEQLILTQRGKVTWRWTLGKGLYWRTGAEYSQQEGVVENHAKVFTDISFNYTLP